jgi:hypothetical protein
MPGITYDGAAEFWCDSGQYIVNAIFYGGVLPVNWVTTGGELEVTGERTVRVKIHTAVSTPVTYYGSAGHVTSPNTPLCNDSGFGYASVRLGKELRKKVGAACVHNCNFIGYTCFDSVAGTVNATCGDNVLVPDPSDCPYSEAQQFNGGAPYGTIGKCFGGCRDAAHVSFSYPDIYYEEAASFPIPDADYGTCGNGKPFGYFGVASGTAGEITLAQMISFYGGSGTAVMDTRHPRLIERGCAPCSLVQNTDLVVTAIDAAGNVVFNDIHIN